MTVKHHYHKKHSRIVLLPVLLLLLSGCSADYLYDDSAYYDEDSWNAEASVLNGSALNEDKGIYDVYADELEHLYLKIQPGKDAEQGEVFSFSYLQNYTEGDVTGVEPYVDVILTEGDESAPTSVTGFGFGEFTANAKLTVKGNTDRIESRSWQLKLYDRAGLYEGMKSFNLIKNNDDASRMKIKLGLDLASQLEDVASLRSKFVRLFVYDTTEGGLLQWEDMGIYTLVEQPNKTFLRSHGLNENAALYRAKNFRFDQQTEIRAMDDPAYDEEAFESVLGIREATDHSKLLEVLALLDDPAVTSEALLSGSFNEENLLTYAAISLLMGNVEGTVTDYLIYSPENSQTWYFIPEDFRNAFEIPEWQSYAYLMNNKVFRIYLQEEENRMKLREKVAEIRSTLTDERISETVAGYTKQLLPYLYSMPEIIQLPIPAADVEPYIASLVDNIAQVDSINYSVLPPYIETYTREGTTVTIDFDSQADLTYYAEVAADRRFSEIIETLPINEGRFEYGMAGSYYLRVVGVTADGERVVCGNISLDGLGRTIYGGVEIN